MDYKPENLEKLTTGLIANGREHHELVAQLIEQVEAAEEYAETRFNDGWNEALEAVANSTGSLSRK